MADKRTEKNLLMTSESRYEGEFESNLGDNIDNKLGENLDDKGGKVVRYATLSLLYLVQVITFVCQIWGEPVIGCSLWLPDLLSPPPAQTGWPLLLQPLCYEAPLSPMGLQASLQPPPRKDIEPKHLADSGSGHNDNDLPFCLSHCKPGRCHFPLRYSPSPQLCFSCSGSVFNKTF